MEVSGNKVKGAHTVGYDAFLTVANTLAMQADSTFGHDGFPFHDDSGKLPCYAGQVRT